MANIKNKNLSTKKYFVAILCVIAIALLFLYFYKWHIVKEDEKYLTSYLISSKSINLEMNELDEIESVLSETPNEYFVYISYTQDEEIYRYEKKLQPIINKYNLQSNFYYLNITDIKQEKNYKEKIAKKLNIDIKSLNEIPVILYFKDGLLEQVIKNDDELKKLVEQ